MSRTASGSDRPWMVLIRGGLAALVVVTLATRAQAGELRAYFDRKSVYEGDTVTLVIETTGDSLGQPDLSGLAADFDLLGTSQSTSISIVNGRRTDTIRLLVSLAPKRAGTIEVPAIDVGGEQSGPLLLQVSEVPDGGTGSAGDDVFLELEVDAEAGDLMVQQQVPLTVRLFTAVPLLKGSLDDPRVDGALVTKLGEDRRYDTRRNGREYRVVERRYSLSPERSGELRIPPLVFEGSARSGKGGGAGSGGPFRDPFFDRFFRDGPLSRDPFGMFERGQPVSARSRALSLNVKARPGGYAGDHWLPAEELEIADSWTRDPPELRVGAPVTRTLTLQARGLAGPQIPEIEIPTPPGLRVYPEKTSSESRSDGESIFGISRQGVTLIPTRSGELVIPEVRVIWWDTAAQQERVARVPGWTMRVEGGSGPEATAPNAATEPQADLVPQVRRDATERGPGSDSHSTYNDPRYLIGSSLLLALLLVGTWGLISYRRKRSSDAARPTPAAFGYGTRAQGSGARKALHRACEANDARAAATALLGWARATWPDDAPRNLGSLGARLPRGGDRVRELERRLYAPETGTWDGASLWDAVRHGLAPSATPVREQDDALAPLYPRRG